MHKNIVLIAFVIALVPTRALSAECSDALFADPKQIEPNPNPVNETLFLFDEKTHCNGVQYENLGTVQLGTSLGSEATLNNVSGATFSNIIGGTLIYGGNSTFNNLPGATLDNAGSIEQISSGTLNNSGTLLNTTTASLEMAGSNSGVVENMGIMEWIGSNTKSGVVENNRNMEWIGFNSNDGTVDNNGFLIIRGLLDNNSELTNTNGLSLFPTTRVNNNAGATLTNTDFMLNSGVLVNEGALVNGFNGRLSNFEGTINNFGVVLSTGLVTNHGLLINNPSGIISNFGNRNSGTYHQIRGSTQIDGSMIQAAVNIEGGILRGTGTITAPVTIDGGIMAPGNSPGTMTILGDYTQSTSGALEVEIGGLIAGTEYDVLDVSGTATLAGLLDVSLFDLGSGLFNPSPGDSFDVLMAETIVGEFDLFSLAILGTGLDWEVDYLLDDLGDDIVRLSVISTSAVPAPAAIWLFATALIGLVAVKRKGAA